MAGKRLGFVAWQRPGIDLGKPSDLDRLALSVVVETGKPNGSDPACKRALPFDKPAAATGFDEITNDRNEYAPAGS